jgi:HPr kinase/phosphorylase
MSAVNVHASCVMLAKAAAIFGAVPGDGILILGASGAGKSSVALKLLAMGAALVADDRVELFEQEQALWARAPASLAGLIEARGLGIVTLPHAASARVTLAVQLGPNAARHPHREDYEPPAPLSVRTKPPLLRLSAQDAAIAEKVVLAAAAFSNALFRQESNPK